MNRTIRRWSPASPSSATEDADARLAYRPDLDFAIAAPDGRLVASCTAWLDEAQRRRPVRTGYEIWNSGAWACRAPCA